MSLGDFPVGATIPFNFTTRKFSTGAPFTLAGSPSLCIYEDDSDVEITAGITLTPDFDGKTGLNHVSIAATGGNSFETGKSYSVVIAAGTVDGVSVVGETLEHFTLGRSAAYLQAVANAAALATIDARIDTEIGTILGWLDTEITTLLTGVAAVQAVTDLLPDAGALSSLPTAAEIAIESLVHDWETIVASIPDRCSLQAQRALRNEVDRDTGTGVITVMEEDDTTPAWTANTTTDAAAEPIINITPV